MFNYKDEIRLINDVVINIVGVFPTDRKYSVEINGIKKHIDDEFLSFLIDKYGFKDEPVKEAVNESIEVIDIDKSKKKKKEK